MENFTKKTLEETGGKGYNIRIVDNLFLYTYCSGYQIIMDLDKMSVVKKVDADGSNPRISICQGGEQITLLPGPGGIDNLFEFIFQAKLDFFRNQQKLLLNRPKRKLRYF